MTEKRHSPKSFARKLATMPFDTAEEAWFWFVRSHQLRREGVRLDRGRADLGRPCDPDDVYCAVMSLARQGCLDRAHLGVLGKFGLEGRPPDFRRSDELSSSRLWTEALERLAGVLRAKDILA